MRASLRLFQEAVAGAGTAAVRPAAATARPAARRGARMGDAPANAATNLVIDVPYTALPSDVHRALKEVGAVPKNYPLSAIIRQPAGSPRKATLTTRYHLTAGTRPLAESMYNVLSSRPLFAAGSARASAQPGRPGFGAHGLKDDARVFYSANDAREWAAKMLQTVQNAQAADYRYASQAAERMGGLPDVDWALAPNARGKRVLLRGLPRDRPVNMVRDFIRDLGVEIEAEGGLKRIVGAPNNSRAAYAVSCKSVADAHYLARRTNMAPYLQSVMGYQYMMRAHVIW